jgi:predicted DNA-binding transcriptional regulator YafY
MRLLPSPVRSQRPLRAGSKSKVGRPRGQFTQHKRIDRLRTLLESEPRGLTLEDLATTLRMTQRSVRRYLRAFDGTKPDEPWQLLEPIATTPGGPQLWRIKPGERGRAVSLRRAQAYTLLATRRALEILRGSALYDEADLALAQIAKVAQTPFRASGKAEISGSNDLEQRFFWVPPPARSYVARGEDVDELFRAVADLRVVRYRPRTRTNAGDARPDRIAFHPYAMVVHEGALLVLGARASRDADDIEGVYVDMMTDIRTSETERFDLPEGFDAGSFLHGQLGIGPLARGRFVVEFDARIADEIRARKIHPLQKIATSPDGRVRVSLPLVSTEAAIRFVLSYGDAARVVDPPELVQDIAERLARAEQRYR